MKKRGFKRFYTLIEIMTVIVIAAILFGIGIPAFSTMIQGSNMTIAIRQLSSKIAAARAFAVTNTTNDAKVAVLLVETTGAKEEYYYSAYRVCVVSGDSGSLTFQEWIEDENWKTLPKGVLRAKIINDDSVTPNKDECAAFETISSVDTEIIGGASSTSVKALVFNKYGKLTKAETAKIRLFQGRYIGGKPIFTERDNDGKIINHPIETNQYSGKVKVKDIEIKTEAQMKMSD